MASPLYIQVYDRRQVMYAAEFTEPVELGRQSEAEFTVYTRTRLAGRWRAVIAELKELTVSRKHALVEPLAPDRVRLTNISTRLLIRLADGRELKPEESSELALPTVVALGKKQVHLQGPEAEKEPLHSLGEATVVPGQITLASRHLAALPLSVEGTVEITAVLQWFQTMLTVLQSAASSSDFFARAAEAVVNLVGLDAGRVLRYDRGEWRVEILHTAAQALRDADWQPSRQILYKVQQEKRTFWQVPSPGALDGASLLGVQAVVAAPILNQAGEVIGALYGDRRQDSMSATTAPITKVQAMLVELLATGVAVGLARLEQEQAALAERIRFEQFFTPELARQLTLQPDLLHGREAEVTLLFCDIRGFSRISERLGPAKTVAWISDVMTALSRCVLAHRGVLVDYAGDELMAMWGAPEELIEPARLACRAALEMLATLPALNQRWQATLQEPIQVGIGLNRGKAWVGNTGSEQKFKYGPLGNTVNLASRVQGATKYLACPLLITQTTEAELEGSFETRRLATVRVVNIAEPVGLYELAAPGRADWPALKDGYERALEAFEQGKFRRAARLLGTLLTEHPDDGAAVVLMSRAVQALVEDSRTFDPVWILPGK